MTDITQLGFPTGFLGLDENQSSTNPVGNISIGDYVSAHRKLENTPSGERSKTSSATGPGGLIDSTQQYLQNKYKLPSGYGTNADINDQYDNALITDQQETLKKSNLEPTALNHRLTSWFGSAGGPKVIASNDTESINNILSPDAIKANGLDPKMTVGALKSKVERNLLDQGVNPKFTVGNTNQTASDSPFSVVQDTNKYTPYQAVPLTKSNIKPVFNPNSDIPTDVGTTPATPTEKTPTQSQLPAYKIALNNINVTKRDIAPVSNATTPNYQKEINAVNTTNASDIEQKYVNPAVETVASLASMPVALGRGFINMLVPKDKATEEAEKKEFKRLNPDLQYIPYEQRFLQGMQKGSFAPKTEGGKKAVSAIGDVISTLPPVFPPEFAALQAEREASGFAPKTLQDQFAAKKTPTPTATPTAGGVASAGAAATSHEAAINEALSSASPKVQSDFQNQKPSNINLEALNTHKQFDKFDMQPTEGEALQDTSKMSDEWNDRTIDPALQHRFEERNPKLIEGFNKIKEKVSPDVFTENPVELANAPLEKMAKIDKAKLADIDTAYQNLENANGGTLPLDGKSFVETAEKNLHTKLVTDALPANLKSALKQFSEGRQMTFEDFKMLGTITAAEMRKGGSEAIAAGVVKDALENMQLTPEAAPLKPLLDHAKSLVKQRYDLIDPKKSTYNPAYATAANDTRTNAEIERGDFHPAANTFISKHYSANTPQVNIQRMLDVIGKDSPEHQALNAAKIDEFKFGSGVKNNNGTVKQEALNKIIYHQNASNLPIMLGNNAVKDLQDLADVARKSEHVRGGPSFANTSNTESVRKRSALGAAKDFTTAAAAKGLEAYLNMHTMGAGGTLLKSMVQGSKEAKTLAALEAEKQALSRKRLGPGAGAKISDIGK